MDFNQLEKPLLELDPIFEKFANKYSLIITKNQKDCPERSIVWGTNVRCLIQLYLSSETGGYFNLWLCASEDTANERFWKHETPIKALKIDDFKTDLYELLEESFVKLNTWANDRSTLEFATKLGKV